MNSYIRKMRIANDMIALESLNVHAPVSSLLSSLTSGINAMKSYIDGTPSYANDLPVLPNNLDGDERNFISELRNVSFGDLGMLSVRVPEGLKVDYLTYSIVLHRAAEHVENNLVSLLDTAIGYVASLNTNVDSWKDTKSNTDYLKKVEKERQDIDKELGQCFETGSTQTYSKVNKVIHRWADWNEVFSHLRYAETKVNAIKRSALDEKKKRIMSLIDNFKEHIEREKIETFSPVVAENLSFLVYQCACELQFYAVLVYYILSLDNSIEGTKKIIRQSM